MTVTKRIIMLGAPGVGKGTQAKNLQSRFGWAHISTGDMLRDAVRGGTELGKKAAQFMEKGELVPDALIIEMVGERLGRPDCQSGFILDGFPRTVVQAEKLNELLSRKSSTVFHNGWCAKSTATCWKATPHGNRATPARPAGAR
jgi:adenylate kinase